MPFTISQKTLERLEWGRILALLAEQTGTPLARALLEEAGGQALFEGSLDAVRARLAEPQEARAVLPAGDRPPLSGAAALGEALRRAGKGGVLAARELLELLATLRALRDTARFLGLRRPIAPGLAALCGPIGDFAELIREVETCLEPTGELRDEASERLAGARREARSLDAEIQKSLSRLLQDPDTTARLSDRYFTLRNDRYVLPVRSDARPGFRGIVHDASSSGTTLFIEPESLVDLNNRRKQAEIEIERETLRVLRRLTAAAAARAAEIEVGLEALAAVDLAFARAGLAEALAASCPEVAAEGVIRLPRLRHPLLPAAAAVANDLCLGEEFTVLVLSGPNAGGKTVALKAVALAALFVRAGLCVPAAEGARVDLFDSIEADIGDEQDIRQSLSTFSAHMANLPRTLAQASRRPLVVLD